MQVNPMIKKSICRLWGHDYVLSAQPMEIIDGGQDIICRRCGKEHFRSYANDIFPDLPENSAREAMVNFSYMNKRQPDAGYEMRH